METDKAKLRCKAVSEENGEITVTGHTSDGDSFVINLPISTLLGYDAVTKECWVYVDYFGKSGGKAYVGLPIGDMRMGRNVTVAETDVDRTDEIIRMMAEKAKKKASP